MCFMQHPDYRYLQSEALYLRSFPMSRGPVTLLSSLRGQGLNEILDFMSSFHAKEKRTAWQFLYEIRHLYLFLLCLPSPLTSKVRDHQQEALKQIKPNK